MPKKEIPNKIKFQSKIPSKENTFFYAVSKDNERQTEHNFSLFVNWIIENKDKVSNVKIILSDYLNRFYVGENAALLWGKEWQEKNKEHLNKLSQQNIYFELINWKVLININYLSFKSKVDKLYLENIEFKTTVDGLAKSYQNRAGFDSAVEYLLEESSVIASLSQGILTYPAPKLNGAIHCALKNLNCGPTYIGHMFIYSKSSYNSQHTLFQSTYKVMCALEQDGYKKDQDKKEFLITATEIYQGLKNKSSFSLFSECLTNCSKKLPPDNNKETLKNNSLLVNTSSGRSRLYSI